MFISAKTVRNFVLAPMLATAIMAQSGSCPTTVQQNAVNRCIAQCGDIGECIFGCEIGGINKPDVCYESCANLGDSCIDSCISTNNAISSGCGTTNVTPDMALKLGTIAYNRATAVWQQTVVVTNTTQTTMNNLGLVLDSLATGWTMTNADGNIILLSPTGSPYKNFGPLAPNASATVTLQFNRTGTSAFSYSPRALSGTGR